MDRRARAKTPPFFWQGLLILLPVFVLAGFGFLSRKWRRTIVPFALVVALVSFGINFIGALHGSMLCDFPQFAADLYISQMLNGQLRAYPLVPWLLGPLMISIGFLVWTIVRAQRTSIESPVALAENILVDVRER